MLFLAGHHQSKLRAAVGRYKDARRSLHTPASVQSRLGLNWMNFFIADVQTGFGTFVAFYLAQSGWSPDRVGIALAAGTIAGVLSQIPGGALADAVTVFDKHQGVTVRGVFMLVALVFALVSGVTANVVATTLQAQMTTSGGGW
jgi:hypothetical protein